MTTTARMPGLRFARLLAPTIVLAAVLAACASGGTSATAAPASRPPVTVTPPTGSAQPGGTLPSAPGPIGGGDELVVPKPGQLDVHPIAADSFAAQVDGHHVVLTITYTSGVEPCSILDTIVVQRGEGSFAVTLREGHGPGNQVCIMIARIMKTQVDLGQLDPGTYTISDTMRGADPIQVVVS